VFSDCVSHLLTCQTHQVHAISLRFRIDKRALISNKFIMNKLDTIKRAQILNMLVEGSSMRSISRVCDVSFNTIVKLLEDAGEFCARFHDANVRNVHAKRVQCDEIWSFTYAKEKNVAKAKAAPDGAGDTWTWTGITAETKLVVSYFVGKRDSQCAKWFMDDVAARLATRVQLTTDGLKSYLDAVERGVRRRHRLRHANQALRGFVR
jgi:hypothetical protein